MNRSVATKVKSALIIGCCIFVVASRAAGQQNRLHAIVQETQRYSSVPNELGMVWWLPEQFWQESMAQDPTASKAQINQMVEVIKPYTMIAIVEGRMGPLGGVTYTSPEAVRSSVEIRDTAGARYAPLDASVVGPDMKNLLQILKPISANMMGSMGENMHFLLFPAKSKDGRPIADPTREGMLSVVVAGKEFKYRLPLGSVLPAKQDSTTGERFPGNYIYNPFTGNKLITESASRPSDPAR